jgi:hypothetical protein
MAKKIKPGRPKGSDKEAMNIYVHKERAAKLRQFARDEQKTISIIVENALESTYNIWWSPQRKNPWDREVKSAKLRNVNTGLWG